MKYRNASKIMPDWLLEKIQEYVQGEIIYVPIKDSCKVSWGEANGTREKYLERNINIISLYKKGCTTYELAKKYHLSECSIKKIIYNMKTAFL